MIGKIHKQFTETILGKLGLSMKYAQWGVAPDEDLIDWHRYKYHRISSFPKLYNYFVEKYDARGILDTKIVSLCLLGHLYLDMISGPVKIFGGLNVTINHKLLSAIDEHGYVNTINAVHKIITHPSEEYIKATHDEFLKLYIPNRDILLVTLQNRLEEETLGAFEGIYVEIPDKLEQMYNDTRNSFLNMEDKLIEYMFLL